MESTIPNEHTLRQITIATLLPAFPMLIAAGVMSEKSGDWGRYGYGYWNIHSTPTIIFFGLIPTFFSAIISAFALKAKHDPLDKRPRWLTGVWVLVDLFMSLAHLAILIPVWIFEPPSMNGHANWMMLETYATVFLMSNMFIHAYLGLYHPLKLLSSFFRFSLFRTECPHCHGRLGTHVETVGRKREGYSLLRAENYLDEAEADADAEASTGVIRLSEDSEA